MKHFFIFLLVLIFQHSGFSQPKLRAVAADCNKAIPLTLKTTLTYGKTIAPSGYGASQEFDGKNKFAFEQEHHSAWYLLKIENTGELAFNIIPEDSTNDYDFVLYPYTDSTFCKQFSSGAISPIRSNLSNNKKLKGITGIVSDPNLKDQTGEGLGNSYSNSLLVKQGQKYMLVVDNFSENGKGHTLEFAFTKSVVIKGEILSSENKPLSAQVILSDKRGATVVETQSDAAGNYEIKTNLKENQDYSLTYIGNSEFVETKIINTKELKTGNTFPPIKTVLKKLKKGEKYKLGNINFEGNSEVLLPSSYSSVESLYMLMKKNPKLIIQIEGHVNDPSKRTDKGNSIFNQKLSDNRAQTIFIYLRNKGIDESRMKAVGLSNKFPLYNSPNNPAQSEANRRVEINVISFE